MKDRPKIGLVLGAGGAKGFAHIGAISVLENAGIPIDLIVGCSIGAVIGGAYALGAKTEHMEEATKTITRSDIMDLRLPDKFGFVKGEKAEKLINNLILKGLLGVEGVENFKTSKTPSTKIKHFMFSDCKIPFYCYATDFYKAEGVVLGRGKLLPAIRASFSIGGVFRPVKIGSRYLLDGGLTSRVPVDIAKMKGADIIIAVDCVGPTTSVREDQVNSYIETITRIFFMMDYKISKEEMNRADVLVQIPQDVDALRFKDLSKSIEHGKKYMTEALPKIQDLIKNYKSK